MELGDKVVIVTGGAVRLGKAMSLSLAQRGVNLVIHYHSSDLAAKQIQQEIKAIGQQALLVKGDLSHTPEAQAIVQHAIEHYGRVDALVNSAAIFEPGNWNDTTEENWDRHFAINLKSPFFLTQAFAQAIGADQHAHVINIADWRGILPGTDHVAYTLTKAALIAMTKSLALALAPNIQVNAIAPGMILPPPGRNQSFLAKSANRIPLQRIGSPAEVVKAMLYLLNSDFVTGEFMYVTGGEHLVPGRTS